MNTFKTVIMSVFNNKDVCNILQIQQSGLLG